MLWFKSKTASDIRPPPSAPDGEVVYAIGDVHGRADLLTVLLKRLKADASSSPHLRVQLVMLGDYIDRGSDSRAVIDMLIHLQALGGDRAILLKGNHEAALLEFLETPSSGAAWSAHGGRETLRSYGVNPPVGREATEWEATRDALLKAMPTAHLELLHSLHLHAEIGDYLFVHAGLRPGAPLEDQKEHDLLWIREDFLKAPRWIDHVIVHGHTPEPEPSVRPGRIGIDTGAYATGVLTALRLERKSQTFIQTSL